MGHIPRTVEEIYSGDPDDPTDSGLRGRLINSIEGLTSFVPTGFNYVWTQAFSEEIREAELDNTAAYLDGLIDYAGGDITEDDLRELGIDDAATVDEINERLEDNNLSELVKIVGVERRQGDTAVGTVTFTTASESTVIPAGTTVATQPDANGEILEFATDSEVSTGSGETTVNAEITAEQVGSDYNVGAGTITYLPDPPVNVQAVSNAEATSGGEDIETNDELRERAKQSIFQNSGGGTVQGLVGYIEQNVEGVAEAEVDEKTSGDAWHGAYPHGHVIVDGGQDNTVLNAIEAARPVSVEHFLVRPSTYTLSLTTNLIGGEEIDETLVESAISSYLGTLGLDDDVIVNKIIQATLNADDDIVNVDSIDFSIENESIYFNVETIDDFESGDILLNNRNWSAWSGDTGSFNAQQGTVVSGSYSAELNSAASNVAVTTSRTSATDDALTISVQIDNQTGNIADYVNFIIYDGVTTIGGVRFRGNGDVRWTGDATDFATWTAGSTHTFTVQFDFDNDQVDIEFDGTETTDMAFAATASEWDTLDIRNDTTTSASTVNAYIDDIQTLEDLFTLGLGEEMLDDGITTVTGTSSGSSVTFTEDTDYTEFDAIGDATDDSVRWILSGDRPDIVERTETIEYIDGRDTYSIENAMVNEGITSVVDASGTTYTEGTDYEEVDLNNDDRDDAIEWLDGGSTPSDTEDFTVTYNASTTILVSYDITDTDLTIDIDEKILAGTISVVVL